MKIVKELLYCLFFVALGYFIGISVGYQQTFEKRGLVWGDYEASRR